MNPAAAEISTRPPKARGTCEIFRTCKFPLPASLPRACLTRWAHILSRRHSMHSAGCITRNTGSRAGPDLTPRPRFPDFQRMMFSRFESEVKQKSITMNYLAPLGLSKVILFCAHFLLRRQLLGFLINSVVTNLAEILSYAFISLIH